MDEPFLSLDIFRPSNHTHHLRTSHAICILSILSPKPCILSLSIYHVDRNTNTWNFFLYTPPKHLLIYMEFIDLCTTYSTNSHQVTTDSIKRMGIWQCILYLSNKNPGISNSSTNPLTYILFHTNTQILYTYYNHSYSTLHLVSNFF